MRRFKPGDFVQQIHKGPVMKVVKYRRHKSSKASIEKTKLVECTWYDVSGGQLKRKIFHENKLRGITKRMKTNQRIV